MAKKRDKSESEHLKGEIRRLQSENRHLKRQLKSYKRQIVLDDDLREEYTELVAGSSNKPLENECPSCGHSPIGVIKVKNKTYQKCQSCSYTKVFYG